MLDTSSICLVFTAVAFILTLMVEDATRFDTKDMRRRLVKNEQNGGGDAPRGAAGNDVFNTNFLVKQEHLGDRTSRTVACASKYSKAGAAGLSVQNAQDLKNKEDIPDAHTEEVGRRVPVTTPLAAAPATEEVFKPGDEVRVHSMCLSTTNGKNVDTGEFNGEKGVINSLDTSKDWIRYLVTLTDIRPMTDLLLLPTSLSKTGRKFFFEREEEVRVDNLPKAFEEFNGQNGIITHATDDQLWKDRTKYAVRMLRDPSGRSYPVNPCCISKTDQRRRLSAADLTRRRRRRLLEGLRDPSVDLDGSS